MHSSPDTEFPQQQELFAIPWPQKKRSEDNADASYIEGRDELNFAEFPIASIGHRNDPSISTLRFTDVVEDKHSGTQITRTLIVTASEEYGLPMAGDDEVLLGFLQLSRMQGFESATLRFTVHQLMKVIGWKPTSHNYHRVHEAINRWIGVTLYYNNAWRDKVTKQWVDARFHFLDYAELYNEKQARTDSTGESVIKWNETVFRSFTAGNLKTLDFHLFRSLNSTVAKRIFRFLDKRFYHSRRVTFTLETFAVEKIGLTRPCKASQSGPVTDVYELKRRLSGAIEELENFGFLVKMDPSARFQKDRRGVWTVHFEKKLAVGEDEKDVEPPRLEEIGVLEGRLIGHGVTAAQAKKLVSDFDESRVETQLDSLEFLLTREKGAPENRAGWLVNAITQNYGLPRGFKTRLQKEREAEARVARARAKKALLETTKTVEAAAKTAEQAEFERNEQRVAAYLASLSEEQRKQVEENALDGHPAEMVREGSRFRRYTIFNHVLALLAETSAEIQRSLHSP